MGGATHTRAAGSKEGLQGSLMVAFIARSVFLEVDTKPLRMQRGFWLLTPLDIVIRQLLGKGGGSFPSWEEIKQGMYTPWSMVLQWLAWVRR